MSTRPGRRIAVGFTALVTLAALVTAPSIATAAPAPAPGHHSGTLADGATWIADVPGRLERHPAAVQPRLRPHHRAGRPGRGDASRLCWPPAMPSRGPPTIPNDSWWALGSAERDQFQTLAAFKAGRRAADPDRLGRRVDGRPGQRPDRPGRRRPDRRLARVVRPGGRRAGSEQLPTRRRSRPGDPAGARLPESDLAGYSSSADAATVAQTLTDAVEAAQQTPAGRARIALAAALLNLPTWAPGQNPPAPGDAVGQEAQQEDWIAAGQLAFIIGSRPAIEQAAGRRQRLDRRARLARAARLLGAPRRGPGSVSRCRTGSER